MDKEIKFIVDNLDGHIVRLRDLRVALAAIDTAAEESDAARGTNSDTMRQINSAFPKIQDAMVTLLDNTISFMSKTSIELLLAEKKAKEEVESLQQAEIGGEI